MSVKVEVIEGGVPHSTILAAGLVSTLVCLYLSYLNVIFSTPTNTVTLFSFFGGLAVVAAMVWGSHTIKVLCSYGIGTGVPSAGMIAFGSGVIAMLLATKFDMYAPIVALVLAAVIGLILGYIANNILNMKIPAMVQALTEMAIIGALSLMGFAALITGGFTFAGLTMFPAKVMMTSAGLVTTYQYSFLGGGLIAVAFLLGAIAIQHPFNACLGPGWKQDRMLMLAAECGFLSMIVAAVMSFALIGAGSAFIALFFAVIGWAYTYSQYMEMSKRDAAAWLDAKPIPEAEAH
jgi:tetrahydromethanopterin S-methyltransferase subunit C